MLFSYFAIPPQYQFRVLFWGVFGALLMRVIFIFAGVALLDRFDWLLYVFGGFLVITGVKIARHSETEVHPEHNPVRRVVRRFVPTTNMGRGLRGRSRRVMSLGAKVLKPAEDVDSVDNFQVYADPAGHPFCLCWVSER